MKIRSLASISLALLLPNLALADLVDFGATTKKNKGGGFLVTGVFQETPAAELGIVEGDIVTSMDGNQLQPTTSLARLIAGVRAAESEVKIAWRRDGEPMSGSVTLSRTLEEKAFDKRYPRSAGRVPMMFGSNFDDLDELDDLADLGVDVEEVEEQIKKMLKGNGLEDLMKNATSSASFSVSKMVSSSDGGTITVNGSGEGKKQVTIKSKDGETVFDEKISKDELEKVPAEYRESVKRLMGNGISVTLPGRAGPGSSDSNVEESAADLLKKLEDSEKKKSEKEDK